MIRTCFNDALDSVQSPVVLRMWSSRVTVHLRASNRRQAVTAAYPHTLLDKPWFGLHHLDCALHVRYSLNTLLLSCTQDLIGKKQTILWSAEISLQKFSGSRKLRSHNPETSNSYETTQIRKPCTSEYYVNLLKVWQDSCGTPGLQGGVPQWITYTCRDYGIGVYVHAVHPSQPLLPRIEAFSDDGDCILRNLAPHATSQLLSQRRPQRQMSTEVVLLAKQVALNTRRLDEVDIS